MRRACARTLLRIGCTALTVACRKEAPTAQPALEVDDAQAVAAPLDASGSAGPASRCGKVGRAVALGDASIVGTDIGDTVLFDGGIAVAFIRRIESSWRPSIAFFSSDGARLDRIVDLPGWSPEGSPHLARRDHDLVAAVIPPDSVDVARAQSVPAYEPGHVVLDSVRPDGSVSKLGSFPVGAVDSEMIDLASDGRGALLVWVEGGSPPDRGSGAAREGVMGAVLSDAGRTTAKRWLSDSSTDRHDSPRAFSTGSGYAVAWLASAVQAPGPLDAAEGPGELRSSGWLQYLETDAAGAPRGPVRDLTPRDGHVISYDARIADGSVSFLALDEGEEAEGAGGSLLRVTVHAAAAEDLTAQRLPVEGVGQGAPLIVGTRDPWLVFWSRHDDLPHLVALDPHLAPIGSPSVEEAMGEARPLAELPAPRPGTVAWLMAAVAEPGPLRIVECAAGGSH